VLVACPVEASAVIDVLNKNAGVVNEGVERGKLGSVVAIVADSEESKEETVAGVSSVLLAA